MVIHPEKDSVRGPQVRKTLIAIVLALGVVLSGTAPALAVYGRLISVVNSTASNYTKAPVIHTQNNAFLASAHLISASGLDVRVKDGTTELPLMLTDTTTLVVGDFNAYSTKALTYTGGNTPASSFKIITGSSGNFTAVDASDLEWGSVFDYTMSGYIDTSYSGTPKVLLYKQNAVKLYVSALNTLKYEQLTSGDSVLFSVTASSVTSGARTIRLTSDGSTFTFYVDGASKGTANLQTFVYYNSSVAGAVPGRYQQQRYGFTAAGRFWWFYSASNDIWYITSPNSGQSWAAAIQVTSDGKTPNAGNLAIDYDGTYCYYGRGIATGGGAGTINWRRGTPNSDGTITWSAAEQTAGSYGGSYYPVVKDVLTSTTGVNFIAVGTQYDLVVLKNNNSNGTWSGSSTQLLNAIPNGACLVAMNSGAIYCAYRGAATNSAVLGKYYNGSAWSGSAETIEATTAGFYGMMGRGGTFANGVMAFTYSDGTATSYIYVKDRAADGSWGARTQICGTQVGTIGTTITYDSVSDTMYLFPQNVPTNTIQYYRTWKNGVLSATGTIATGIALSQDDMWSERVRRSASAPIAIARVYSTTMYLGSITYPYPWTDSAYNWFFCANNSAPYTDNVTLTVSGNQVLLYKPTSIVTASTIPDSGSYGSAQNATINWGTTSTGVTTTEGDIPGTTTTAPIPTVTFTGWPTQTSPWTPFPTGLPTPTNLFPTGNPGTNYPGGGQAGHLGEGLGGNLWLGTIVIIAMTALVVLFIVFRATQDTKMGVRGSVFLACVAAEAVLVYFYAGVNPPAIPGWTLVPIGLIALVMLVLRNPQAPVH
jgi:hypothetical protein